MTRKLWVLAVTVLAGVGLVGALGVRALAAPKPWADFPDEVQGVGGPIPVVVVAGFADPNQIGGYDPMTRSIAVHGDLGESAAWLVLWHEVVHAALSDVGVTLDEGKEEQVANAVAAAIVQMER